MKIRLVSYDYLFGILVLIHGFVLTKLIYYPYPELFIYPYLVNKGLVPYSQILDQHFPGLMFLPINLNNLGMLNEFDARWWSIGVVLIIQLFLYLISARLLKRKLLAIFVCVLYLVWQPFFEGWVLWIDSFLPIMLLPAFYFTVKGIEGGKRSDIFLSGLFLGAAIVFKQVILPLALMIGIVHLWKRPKLNTVIMFGGGIFPLPLLMVGYFWLIGVFQDFWYWTVTFNLTTFAELGKKPPFFSGVARLAGVYLPAVGLIFIKRPLALCLAVYILGGLAAIYARFDFVHLQPSLPFVCMATVLVFERLWKMPRLKLLIFGYLIVSALWLSVFYQGHLTDRVLFFDAQTYAVAGRVMQLTTPNEEVFLWGVSPHIYSMSQTIPAGRIFVFQFPWFLQVSGRRVLSGLEQSKPKLILRDPSVTMDGKRMSEIAPEIDNYIQQNYLLIEKIGRTEFMRRKNEN